MRKIEKPHDCLNNSDKRLMSKVKHLQKKARMELHRAHKLRDVCSEFFEH